MSEEQNPNNEQSLPMGETPTQPGEIPTAGQQAPDREPVNSVDEREKPTVEYLKEFVDKNGYPLLMPQLIYSLCAEVHECANALNRIAYHLELERKEKQITRRQEEMNRDAYRREIDRLTTPPTPAVEHSQLHPVVSIADMQAQRPQIKLQAIPVVAKEEVSDHKPNCEQSTHNDKP